MPVRLPAFTAAISSTTIGQSCQTSPGSSRIEVRQLYPKRHAPPEPMIRHSGDACVNWRPRRESNPRTRICSPLRNHSATWPIREGGDALLPEGPGRLITEPSGIGNGGCAAIHRGRRPFPHGKAVSAASPCGDTAWDYVDAPRMTRLALRAPVPQFCCGFPRGRVRYFSGTAAPRFEVASE